MVSDTGPNELFSISDKASEAHGDPGPVTSEIRFAVVMYGGVSLAIYMNGIAQELLSLVRSTARKGWAPELEEQFRFEDQEVKGTEHVYRKLAKRLTDRAEKNGVRFIVDILSGTSAGGINAIFLSKALAMGQSMDELQDLWIQQGDIDKLLNDDRSVNDGVYLPTPSKQKSLLNGDRMYWELLDAFTGMDFPIGARVRQDTAEGAEGNNDSDQSLVEELDLYVTTTDVRGSVIPLRTSDRLVYERNYKHAFHLAYSRPDSAAAAFSRSDGATHTGRNDFICANNPFLAFAARCTSSFPFAFEPMTFGKVKQILPCYSRHAYQAELSWEEHFFTQAMKEDGELDKRPFGDGGYLDNKPFGYVIDTLPKRSSDIPSYRKLLYIEPAPEHPELSHNPMEEPDAIENSLAALVTLPDYQPIREDLLRINDRNRIVRKVRELIERISDTDFHSHQRSATDFPSIAELSRERGTVYASYMLLRVFDVTDQLADTICRAMHKQQEGSYFYAIRCIVRAWRERVYERGETNTTEGDHRPASSDQQNPSLISFLKELDLGYEIRRLRFVRTQINAIYGSSQPNVRCLSVAVPESRRTAGYLSRLLEIKGLIDIEFQRLRAIARYLHSNKTLQELSTALSKEDLNQVLGVNEVEQKDRRGQFAPRLQRSADDAQYVENARKLLLSDERKHSGRLLKTLNDMVGFIRNQVLLALENSTATESLHEIKSDADGAAADEDVRGFYDRFEEYDAAIFPVIYGTDVGEPDWVEVIRVSPEDACSIVDELGSRVRKLKGIWLGHFGGFLDPRWRVSDILWGRLDAAERIISSLLPGAEGQLLVTEAHNSILADFIEETAADLTSTILDEAVDRLAGAKGDGK